MSRHSLRRCGDIGRLRLPSPARRPQACSMGGRPHASRSAGSHHQMIFPRSSCWPRHPAPHLARGRCSRGRNWRIMSGASSLVATDTLVMPRACGIQYSEAIQLNTNVSGILGHPPSRVTTWFVRRARNDAWREWRSNKLICPSGKISSMSPMSPRLRPQNELENPCAKKRISLAVSTRFHSSRSSAKNIPLCVFSERCLPLTHPASCRGTYASSRYVEAGCDGRGGGARRAAPMRTAKSCGPGAPMQALRS